MTELPKVGDLDPFEAGERRKAQQVGVEALERELDVVEIALYVKGRMITTKTDSVTVQRIMAILTGLGQ